MKKGNPVSLITQMGETAGGRFSHCLVPFLLEGANKSSKLSFGDNAIVSGEGVVSTPLIISKDSSFYYLRLLGVSVGNKRINVPAASASSPDGNIIIDSGTTLTFLPADIYPQVESAVAAAIPLVPLPKGLAELTLCYDAESDIKVPDITVHFDGGADLKLNSSNAYFRVSSTLCLGFGSASGGEMAIYGNNAQMNYLVGYDMVKNVVSFKPTDCANY